MSTALVIVFVGVIIFLAHFFVGLFSRTKIPDVLWLFFIGIMVGPVFKLVTPAHFGVVGPIFTTVTLVFILFESGLDLRIGFLRKSLSGTFKLTLFNFIATVITITLLANYFTDLGWLKSIMLGSILGGTSSAVVTTLIRKFDVQEETSTLLILESAVSDVFTLGIPIALMAAYKSEHINLVLLSGQMVAAFVLAVLLGIGGGLFWGIMINRIPSLRGTMFTTPAFAFILYGIVELLGFSGPIAALAFGVVIGNIKYFRLPLLNKYTPEEAIELSDVEKTFFSEVVFLLRTFFFVYIGLSIQFDNMWLVSLGLIFTLCLYIIRIPVVHASVNKYLPLKDVSLISVLIPKGLGAAVLATLPAQMGIPGGDVIQTITFSVIFSTTVITTIFAFLIDKGWVTGVFKLLYFNFDRAGKAPKA